MAEHKYKIGDVLAHKGALASYRQPGGSFNGLITLTVLERITSECSGGVQLLYNCRAARAGEVTSTFIVNECEVEPMPEVAIREQRPSRVDRPV